MIKVLAVRNDNNDLLPVFSTGDSVDVLPKYFRFTGPLVKRQLEGTAGSVFIVEYETRKENRRINLIRGIGKDEIMETGQGYVVKVVSVGGVAPLKIKEELDNFSTLSGVRNIVQLMKIVYASVVANMNPVLVPLEFDKETAMALVDILAHDDTIAQVVEKGNTFYVIYNSPCLLGKVSTSPVAVSAAVWTVAKSKVDAGYFYMEPDVAVVANILFSLYSNADYTGVHTMLLSGLSGYGKTAFCVVLAEKLGMELVNFDMSLVVETEEVMGHRSIEGGSTTFQLNEFAEKVQKGNCIIVLDELNRTYAAALNALFPFLDHRRGNVFQGHNIKVGERVIFIGTRNVGIGYVGTHQSDDALLRRFQFAVNVGNLPKEEEIKLLIARTGIDKSGATRIAKTAKALREADLEVNCPPSTTLLVAQMATFGVEARITFQMNLVNKIEDIEKRRAVEELLNRELGMTFDDALAKTAIAKVF